VEVVTPKLPNPPIRSLDLIACGIVTVIWCTGFEGNYDWVSVPGTLDDNGQPKHNNGVAVVPGIYFAGMDFAVTRKSGTIMAVDEESRSLTEHIVARLRA
jgi:putative flavoprotein involved in K+ transport